MNKRMLITVGLLLLFLHSGVAQKYSFINYNTTAGLASNEVRGLFQDKKGALFVTTTAGISIFDGYRFKNFGFRDGITYDYVKNFAELGNGTMYLFGNTGKEAYIFKNNIYKGSFQTPNVVTQYFTDKENNGFVCTDNGIFRLTDTTFKKIELITDTSRLVIACYKYLQANDSIALVLRTFPQNRFDIINTKRKKIIYTIPGFFGFHFLKDSRKRIWVCSDSAGVKMIDEESLLTPGRLFEHTPGVLNSLEGTQINYATEDKKGNIWFATTGKGLVKLAPDGSCQYLSKENGLLSNTIFRVFADRDDHLWIGTESGLQRMLSKQVILYDKSAGLPDDATYDAIVTDNGKLILSSQHNVSVIEQNTNKIRSYPLPHPEEGYIIRFLKKGTDIWGMTPKRILQISDNNPNPVREVTLPSDEMMKDFVQLKDGSLLAISNTKITRYKNNKPAVLINNLSSTGRAIIEDNDQHIWAGTNKGLYVYNMASDSSYMLTPMLEGHIFDGVFQIRFFTKDSDGNIWAATRERGLFQLSIRDNKLIVLKKFTRENGLSNDNVRHLLFTNDSTIICGTISGIDKIVLDRKGARPAQITKLIHLPDNSFAIKKNYAGNQLLIPFLGGLIIYPEAGETLPGSSKNNTFTECYVNGKEYTGILADETLRFGHHENNLLFYFSPHTYSNNECRFLYWLDNGEDENWSDLGFRNYVQFNNLAQGHYTLHIKAIEEDAGKSVTVISKKFTIRPLWYQTLLSKIAGILAAAGISLYFIRRRIKQIRKNASIKQQIAETEMAVLKAQMNPHFMFNCINSIDAFIHSNDKYNATLYLNKFAKLLRNVLESSKQNTVQFSKDIETLKLYIELEELRHENKFKTTLDIKDDLLNSDYKVPPLIIQPFVENAILHGLKNKDGQEGILSITVNKISNRIQYTITDNGIGREAAQKIMQNKESHYGMQMSYERIKLFNKEKKPSVEVTDLVNPAGTKVQVLLNII